MKDNLVVGLVYSLHRGISMNRRHDFDWRLRMDMHDGGRGRRPTADHRRG